MQRKKEIPNKPRFKYAAYKAYSLLLEWGINSFPISAQHILDLVSDYVECISWTEARKLFNTDDPFHLMKTKSEARTIKQRNEDLYLIVYNESVASLERLNWTILHEIAHIVLGHLDEFGATALDRGGLTKKDYGVLEVEANWFVSELLMPAPILKGFSNLSVTIISTLFGVSEEAAIKKHKRLYGQKVYKTTYDEKLYKQFYNFLYFGIPNSLYQCVQSSSWRYINPSLDRLCRKCSHCDTLITDTEANCCYNCGEKLVVEPEFYIPSLYLSGNSMFERFCNRVTDEKVGNIHPHLPHRFHSSYKNKDRLIFCPNCLNNDLEPDAKFCSICGLSLYNTCSAEGIELPFNTQYCPKCGAASTISTRYSQIEKRIDRINNADVDSDWLKYEDWPYVKMRIINSDSEKCRTLAPAIYYTSAFLDDDDNIILLTDREYCANEIQYHTEIILDTIKRYDVIKPSTINIQVIDGGKVS